MSGTLLPIENTELLMPSPSLPAANEQNDILFDNLLTTLLSSSQYNSTTSPLPMPIREGEKGISSDVLPSIERNKEAGTNKDRTNSPAFPSFFSDICNCFSIAGNLLINIEKDAQQGVMINDKREGKLSYGTESPNTNSSPEYHALKDAQVFNTTPFFKSAAEQEDPLLQATNGAMPSDDTGSSQGSNIQTDLPETIQVPLTDKEILSPFEKVRHVGEESNKESNYVGKEFISKPTSTPLPGLTGHFGRTGGTSVDSPVKTEEMESGTALDTLLRGPDITYRDIVSGITNNRITKSAQISSSLTTAPGASSLPEVKGQDTIVAGFQANLQGDRSNDIQILPVKLQLPVFTDLESSTPREASDAQTYFVLKNGDPGMNTAPYIVGGDGKNNAGLRGKLRITNPESFSPVLLEETQSPGSTTSLKLTLPNEISPPMEDPLKNGGSRDSGHDQKTFTETFITQAEDVSPLITNKNSNENSPLPVNILRNPLDTDVFLLQRKNDASIEVSLEPEGMGKIDIELTLDRGLINAQINTSDIIGKEIIERNLYGILSSLTDEGLNIGSFSISLRNRQGDMNDNNREEAPKNIPAIKTAQIPITLSQDRIISIFV